jgi:hypothetical protein
MSQPAPENRREAPETTEYSPSIRDSRLEAKALDAVVRATIDSASAEEQVTPEEIEALRAVAQRLGPGPLVLDPVSVELVEAIINVNYGQLRRAPEVWRATAVKIATLLFDSPSARARLENLWQRLIESHGPSHA